MTLTQGCNCPCRESLFIPLPDFSLLPKLDNNMFDQLAGPIGANFPIAVISDAAIDISIYTENDL